MKVTVIGQGYVGLPVAVHSALAGNTVSGFDIDSLKIEKLKNGISDSPDVSSEQIISLLSSGHLTFSSNIYDHKESSIYVIAVPTPIDSNFKPELEYLKNACSFLSKIVKAGDLIINESTSYIGTLRNLIKPMIEQESGLVGLSYAVAPERIDPGNRTWSLKNTPRNLSGLTTDAIERAHNFYREYCDSINIVSSPEVAEGAKLFENTFRHVNIALVNEFSEIATHYGFSASEAVSAAATKPFGYMPFYPSIGVGGHCIPVDPSYLLFSATEVGIESKFIEISNQLNSSSPRIVAERVRAELGGTLKGKSIQVVGITYKPNVADLRESPAIKFMSYLKSFGAKVSWFDPYIDTLNDEYSVALNPQVDLGLIVTAHDNIDFTIWRNSGTKVLDLSANSNNFGWPKFL